MSYSENNIIIPRPSAMHCAPTKLIAYSLYAECMENTTVGYDVPGTYAKHTYTSK